jgi:hypothetical protein
MTRLIIPNRFRDGQPISGAQLDANFNAVKAIFNTTKLTQENLRATAGIGNARKPNPRALVPLAMSLPSLVAVGAGQIVRAGYLAFPPPEAPAKSATGVDMPNGIGAAESDAPAFEVLQVQGCYGSAENLAEGDELYVHLLVNRAGAINPEAYTHCNIKSEGLITSTAVNLADVESLEMHVVLATSTGSETRTVRNIVVTAWCKMLHAA